MRRLSKFVDPYPSRTIPAETLSVSEILQRFLTEGTIPVATNVRDYTFQSREDFDGDFGGDKHPDLFSIVSRESREAASKKAAMATSPSKTMEGISNNSEGAAAPADGVTDGTSPGE